MKNTYLQPTNIYIESKKRYEELSMILSIIEKRRNKYPEGKIHIVNRKNTAQYYLRTNPKDKSGVYIHKDEEKKIAKYLQKKYDESVASILKKEIKNLEKLVKGSDSVEDLRSIYSKQPADVKNRIIPIDISDEDFAKQWIETQFKAKSIDNNITMFVTDRGERVRSKSELNIANALNRLGYFYKYGHPFKLSNGRIIYPDFTVLSMKRRCDVYWEHRGMMDNRDYANHAVLRIRQLQNEGLVLGENLLITEETAEHPLGTPEIERIIKLI